MSNLKAKEITGKILTAFYTVYKELGYGFLEKVYENAMLVELRRSGLRTGQQVPIQVYYDGHEVGQYFADLAVEHAVIIEVKVADAICDAHEAQLINYLKATDAEVGLVLNFGPKPEFMRRVFSNERKRQRHRDASMAVPVGDVELDDVDSSDPR